MQHVTSVLRGIGCLGLFLWLSSAWGTDLLIEGASLLSVEPARIVGVRNVLIRDGRIVTISEQPISTGGQRLNARGKFLTPGLMDSHVHVSDPAGVPYTNSDMEVAALRASFLRQQPRSYLYFGVTQLLDPSNYPETIATYEAQPQRPDLFRCGAAPVLDGYPSVFLDPGIRYRVMPDWIFEPANAGQHPVPAGEAAAEHTPEAVVERIAKSGARCVKVFIEDGFGESTEWPPLSESTLKQVTAAAHRKGLLVLAHANALGMQRIAVAGGADVLAHGLWNWDGLSAKAGIPPQIAEHLRTVRERRIGFQPTLRVLYGTADLFRHDTLLDPVYAKVVPADVLAWYRSDAGQFFKKQMRSAFNGAPDEKIMQSQFRIGEQGMRVVKQMFDAGYPLLLGSDTPSAPTYGNQPGYDTYREMRAMAQSGVSLAAIAQAGTINNARQFRLERDYGSVEVGKIANLLLLNADPLLSVRAWSQIDKVILRGVVIQREDLAADRLR
ncbi:MAG: amidohydrolase family protein [Steroidobacteraceae bacterium]